MQIDWFFMLAGVVYWCYVNLLFSFSSLHLAYLDPLASDAVWFYSLFGQLCALLLVALRPRKEGLIVGNAGWVTTSCAFIIAGALMLFAIQGESLQDDMLYLAGSFAGFGTGFTFVFFAELFSRMNLRMILLYAGAQQFFGVLLYLVIAPLAPVTVAVLIVMLVLCQSVLFARIGGREISLPAGLEGHVWVRGDVTVPMFVVAALLIGSCYGLTRALAVSFASPMVALSPTGALGGLGGGLLLIGSSLLFLKNHPAEYLYQIIIPILAFGLVMVPLLASGIVASLPILLVCSSYFYGLLWFFVVLAQRDSDNSITRLAALSFFCFQLGQLMGVMFVGQMPDPSGGIYAISIISLFVVIVLLVIFFSRQRKTEALLLRKAEERKLEAECERVRTTYGLTQRESEIFRMLALGISAKQIAKRFVLSDNTVKTHIRHVYQKLSIHSRDELNDVLRIESSGMRYGEEACCVRRKNEGEEISV